MFCFADVVSKTKAANIKSLLECNNTSFENKLVSLRNRSYVAIVGFFIIDIPQSLHEL